MEAVYWYLIIGLVLFFMAVSHHQLKHVPITSSIIYLLVGFAFGPTGLGVLEVHFINNSLLLERVAEVAVIVSLFTAGLKLRLSLRHPWWRKPLALAFLSMSLTVGLIAVASHYFLHLPWGGAVLLGAILAPTDPVLASDVQLEKPGEKDELKFALTGEAGFNDGTAFPFVLLGVGLLGLHPLGEWGLQWFLKDVLWAIAGGILIGACTAYFMCQVDIRIRQKERDTVILDDFLALALIAVSYGIALWLGTYGFLAVFAAGVTTRQLEMRAEKKDQSTDTADRAKGVLQFNEQFERLCAVIVVIFLGSMLNMSMFNLTLLASSCVLFFLVRPISVVLVLGKKGKPADLALISWFGIRGVGSVYYLFHGINHGVDPVLAQRLIELTMGIIAISILVHGLSVTPALKKFHST